MGQIVFYSSAEKEVQFYCRLMYSPQFHKAVEYEMLQSDHPPAQVDVDGSGFLEFPEFCLMMYKKLSDTDSVKSLTS